MQLTSVGIKPSCPLPTKPNDILPGGIEPVKYMCTLKIKPCYNLFCVTWLILYDKLTYIYCKQVCTIFTNS